MCFTREVYVATKLIGSFSQDEGMTHPLSEECQRFFALRTLELYYRSVDGVVGGGAPQQEKDKLVGVCFLMMHKLYDTCPMLNLDSYYPFVRNVCPVGNVLEFRETYKRTEAAVLRHIKWCLAPFRMMKIGQDMSFVEAWQFERNASRPAAWAGPLAAEVEAVLDEQERSLRLLLAVKRTSSWFQCGGFFMRESASLPGRLRPLHDGVVALCRLDGVFCNTVWAYCAERYGGQVPAYIDSAQLSVSGLPGLDSPVANAVRASMVAALAQHMVGELHKAVAKLHSVQELVSRPPSSVEAKEYEAARETVKELAGHQVTCHGITMTLQYIHHASLHACRELGQMIDALIGQSAPLIKAAIARSAAPVVFHTVTTRKSGSLILTRVSSDPYKTPSTGRKHKVDVIPGPVKVLIKTYAVAPGSRRKNVIKVELKPSYTAACNSAASAYVARVLAADAAISAAQASEEAAMASAAEHSAAAAAAIAAAEEAEEAEEAADEAEAAANAAAEAAEAEAA
jgi:hypothetical protein